MTKPLAATATVVAAALCLAGCVIVPIGMPWGPHRGDQGVPRGSAPTSTATDFTGEWVLTGGSDDAGAFDLLDTQTTLRLDGERSGGSGPCNVYGVSISGGPGTIDVESGMMTQMACEQPVMDLEFRYQRALAASDDSTISDGSLTLTGPGVQLDFEALTAGR